jgi:hypothetical protein
MKTTFCFNLQNPTSLQLNKSVAVFIKYFEKENYAKLRKVKNSTVLGYLK